jgi:hypothetical protein
VGAIVRARRKVEGHGVSDATVVGKSAPASSVWTVRRAAMCRTTVLLWRQSLTHRTVSDHPRFPAMAA